MPTALTNIFETEGTLEIIGGNRPFLLQDPDSVWFIQSGNVEIFSVRVEAGRAVGTRFHFATVGTGQLLFGMGSSQIGLGRGCLAVGLVNTRLRRVPLARLQQLSQDPAYADEMAGLIDCWVAGLSAGVSKDVNPRTELVVDGGQTLEVPAGKRFKAKKGVLWVARSTAELLFIGTEEMAALPPGQALPFTPDSWLQALEKLEIETVSTKQALASTALWRGLTLFYELIFKCEAVNKRLAEVDEFNRLQDRVKAGEKAERRALVNLVSVLAAEKIPETPIEDALFKACTRVGQELGVDVLPPPEMRKGLPLRDPLGAIVKASRLRFRVLALQGQWWRQEAGPMLAFFGPDRKPVALIQESPRAYKLFDPETSIEKLVTKELAAQLDKQAFCFYRPLPEEFITLWQLIRFGMFGLKNELVRLVLMGVLGGLLGLVVPIATGIVFDVLVPEAQRGQLLQIALGMVLIAIAIGVFDFIRSLALLRIEGKMDQNAQAAVIDRLFKLPAPFFRRFSSGDLAERANGISVIRQTVSNTLAQALLGNIFALFNLALLFYYDIKLALVGCGLIAIAFVFTVTISLEQVRCQRQITARQGRISGMVLQFLTGISKLRVAAAEMLAFSAWSKEYALQKKLTYQARKAGNRLVVFNAVFPILASAVLFFAIVKLSAAGTLSPGSFLAFYTAFTTFLAAMLVMTVSLVPALNIIPLFERVRPILETLPEVNASKFDPGPLSGALELSHVSFRYGPSSPLVLKNVSMQIRPGEFIAIVGPSGSGKSSLMRLLLGFDHPETGAIHLDGQDLAEMDIAAVRRQFGIVLQTSKLMPGHILSNIIGTLPLTEDDAWEAARMAGLEEDIKNLPMGMHTVISGGGGAFSGGQRQRLMIARAVVHKPRILLFDEATSALDNRTQAIVSESLEKLQATRLVIAHRLSTIMKADRIFVLQGGCVVQEGTFEGLLKEPGLFQDLARRQLVDSEQADAA